MLFLRARGIYVQPASVLCRSWSCSCSCTATYGTAADSPQTACKAHCLQLHILLLLLLLLQVCIYSTLLPLVESGGGGAAVTLPAAVSRFMEQAGSQAAVKQGLKQVRV